MTRKLLLILYASLAAAQHAAVGAPSGNPISRPMSEVVPACKPFTITWQATTPNSISLILLLGPSTNIRPISTIGTGIANTGSYVWTPGGALQADATHYGLQLIDDVTGQYQFSTQFGISKGPECNSTTFPSSEDASPPPNLTSSATRLSSPSATASNRPQDISDPSPRALKPGIAAAISIGAAAGVLFIAMSIFMAYRLGRRRDTAQQQEDDVASDTDVQYFKSELHGEPVNELHGHHVMHELNGEVTINELESPVAELHGGTGRKDG